MVMLDVYKRKKGKNDGRIRQWKLKCRYDTKRYFLREREKKTIIETIHFSNCIMMDRYINIDSNNGNHNAMPAINEDNKLNIIMI